MSPQAPVRRGPAARVPPPRGRGRDRDRACSSPSKATTTSAATRAGPAGSSTCATTASSTSSPTTRRCCSARGPEGNPFLVLPVGKVGIDEVGLRLRAEMSQAGMDTRLVDTVPGHPTLLSVCFQYPDGSGGNITTVDSAAATPDRQGRGPRPPLARPRDPGPRRARGPPRGAAAPAPPRHREGRVPRGLPHLGGGGRGEGGRTPARSSISSRSTRTRPRPSSGAPVPEEGGVGLPAPAARRRPAPACRLLVTAGARGALRGRGAWTHVPALTVPVVSTAGAGDALLGGVLAGLAGRAALRRARTAARGARRPPPASALDLGACVAAFR